MRLKADEAKGLDRNLRAGNKKAAEEPPQLEQFRTFSWQVQ